MWVKALGRVGLHGEKGARPCRVKAQTQVARIPTGRLSCQRGQARRFLRFTIPAIIHRQATSFATRLDVPRTTTPSTRDIKAPI